MDSPQVSPRKLVLPSPWFLAHWDWVCISHLQKCKKINQCFFYFFNCGKISINRGMDKEDVIHLYNGILLNHKKEQNCTICRDMCGPRDGHTDWSKSEKEKQIYVVLSHWVCGNFAVWKYGANQASSTFYQLGVSHISSLCFHLPLYRAHIDL